MRTLLGEGRLADCHTNKCQFTLDKYVLYKYIYNTIYILYNILYIIYNILYILYYIY